LHDEIAALTPATPNAAATRIRMEAMSGTSFREDVSDSAAMMVVFQHPSGLFSIRPALSRRHRLVDTLVAR
jgi:hypothetical protein